MAFIRTNYWKRNICSLPRYKTNPEQGLTFYCKFRFRKGFTKGKPPMPSVFYSTYGCQIIENTNEQLIGSISFQWYRGDSFIIADIESEIYNTLYEVAASENINARLYYIVRNVETGEVVKDYIQRPRCTGPFVGSSYSPLFVGYRWFPNIFSSVDLYELVIAGTYLSDLKQLEGFMRNKEITNKIYHLKGTGWDIAQGLKLSGNYEVISNDKAEVI